MYAGFSCKGLPWDVIRRPALNDVNLSILRRVDNLSRRPGWPGDLNLLNSCLPPDKRGPLIRALVPVTRSDLVNPGPCTVRPGPGDSNLSTNGIPSGFGAGDRDADPAILSSVALIGQKKSALIDSFKRRINKIDNIKTGQNIISLPFTGPTSQILYES